MSGTWASGWVTGDVVTAAEFRKGMGCVADSTLGVAAVSIDLTGLPTSYAHLLVRAYVRTDRAATADSLLMRFNADTAANYDYQNATFNSTTVATNETFAATSLLVGECTGNTAPASVFSVHEIFIANYAYASGNKDFICQSFNKRVASAGGMVLANQGGTWRSNSAINRITILPGTGPNLMAGSRMSVYVMGS